MRSNKSKIEFDKFFQLDLDATWVRKQILEAGPEMEPYLDFTRGLRVLRYGSPVECIFTFLCTANNHVARITTMVRHLASYGERLEGHPEHREFPDLERLALLREDELRAAGFGYRAASLPKVAAQLLDRGGDRYIHALSSGSLKDLRCNLISLPSIGPKLADCIALFGFGFRNAVPVDTHMWKAATSLYFPEHAGTALTQQKYEEFADFFQKRFGDHAGWAHQALFYESLLNWRGR